MRKDAKLRSAKMHKAISWAVAMRVCHLGKFYHPAPGGMETHVRTLAQAQAESGAEVRVVCVNHQDRRGAT